jgi:hypothetical protein
MACFKRLSLWRRHIWFHEFHRLAILRSAAYKERGHDCFKSKWCAGSALLYWITHLTSRAAIFERTDTTEKNLSCLLA